ncbi:MAG: hypothetical protein AB7J28_15770 [Hyphomonadaceae bacterium]
MPALYSALAVLMQFIAAGAARAARWAQKMEIGGNAALLARLVVIAAGLWNAYSVHNAFHHALPPDADLATILIAWLVSGAVAFVEIMVYDVDETLKSAYARSKAQADQAWEDNRRAESRAATGKPLERVDIVALTDEMLEKAIAFHTGQKRRMENERSRRRKQNIIAKERVSKD